jgi:hypothetical protein
MTCRETSTAALFDSFFCLEAVTCSGAAFNFFSRGQMDNHMDCRAHADLLRGLFSPVLSHAQCIFVRVFLMLVHVNLLHKIHQTDYLEHVS